MQLGGRIQGAVEVLEAFFTTRASPALLLKDWAKAHRFAGAKDRAAIGNLVYDVLRHKILWQWQMQDDSLLFACYAALLHEYGYDFSTLAALLKDDRYAPPLLSYGQYEAFCGGVHKEAPAKVEAQTPEEILPFLRRSFPQDWPQAGAALAEKAPIDLRVNNLVSTPFFVLEEVKKFGFSAVSGLKTALRLKAVERGEVRKLPLQAQPLFLEGGFEMQDLAAQIICLLIAPQEDRQLLDYCAGAGGKTLALGALMHNGGKIYAYDREEKRLQELKKRVKRAHLHNVHLWTRRAQRQAKKASMDVVLLDVPCSGSGTWRRYPELKWQTNAAVLQKRIKMQAEILREGAAFVKKGGRLAYVTCSVFYEENEAQIEKFLKENSNFMPCDPEQLWQKHMNKNVLTPFFTAHGILFAPHKSETDGFYLSLLRRHG